MSNTIEERATSYASRYDYKGDLLSMDGDIKNAYMQGATDQQKIDVEKACEWMKQNLWTFTYTKHGETNYDVDLAVERFRKAM